MKSKNSVFKVILGLFVIFLTGFIILKNSSGMDVNLMGVFLIGYPLFTLITSIVMQLLIKKKVIVLSIIFIVYLIATFASLAYFTPYCLIYCFIYTLIALIGTFVADLILKYKKKFTT